MPARLTVHPDPYEAPLNRVRWTRRQCDAMREAGFLTGRYELIDGEILNKMGQKPAHAYVINRLMAWLISIFGADFLRIQLTIDLSATSPDYDEPDPGVVVTAQSYGSYWDRHPDPQDLLLLIEVSDATLRFDQTTKAALYARAGIAEYWIMDLVGRRAIVHRQPAPEGYVEVIAYGNDETVRSLARPDASVRISDLLPPV
jgi:Uma2 family endonuclease